MKWQPKGTARDAKRLGVLVERAMVRLLLGPVELFRAMK
jgi:hypothetical protein